MRVSPPLSQLPPPTLAIASNRRPTYGEIP
jgi:hypothetical protein